MFWYSRRFVGNLVCCLQCLEVFQGGVAFIDLHKFIDLLKSFAQFLLENFFCTNNAAYLSDNAISKVEELVIVNQLAD